MKTIIYFLIKIIIFSSLGICEESKTKYSNVKIDDLFIESEEVNEKENKTNYEAPDFNPLNEEDLELESLEISDIDITTFGEYEDFLNKYYDENFLNINSKFLRQLEFNFSTSFGSRIPFGANTKSNLNSGADLGISVSPPYIFKIYNFDSRAYINLNQSYLPSQNSNHEDLKITRLTLGTTSFINNNFFTKFGLSFTYSKGGILGDPLTEPGISLNVDLGYKINIIKELHLGIYCRAQSMMIGSIDPPIDGGGSIETLSIGLLFDSPIFLKY